MIHYEMVDGQRIPDIPRAMGELLLDAVQNAGVISDGLNGQEEASAAVTALAMIADHAQTMARVIGIRAVLNDEMTSEWISRKLHRPFSLRDAQEVVGRHPYDSAHPDNHEHSGNRTLS